MTEPDQPTAEYRETDSKRVLESELDGRQVAVAQNWNGYAMVLVR